MSSRKYFNKNTALIPRIPLRQKIILITGGILFCLIMLELGLRFSGFILLSLQEYRNKSIIYTKGTYRILCLGDSTTAWGGINSYPSQLEEILNQANLGIRFSVINKGKPGIKSSYILMDLEQNLKRYNPDMVITLMGINDARTRSAYEDSPVPEIQLFLEHFKVYNLGKLIWLSMSAKIKMIASAQKNIITDCNTDKGCLASGWAYLKKRKYVYAEAAFKKALELNPGNYKAYETLSWFYGEQGKYDLAEKIFKKIITLNPRTEQAYVALGWVYLEEGNDLKAKKMFRRAIELNPENPEAYIGLGWFYKNLGDSIKAEELYKKAIELNPSSARAYTQLGYLYKERGERGRIEWAFKKAIELDPEIAEAYEPLGSFYEEQGKYNQAEEVFKKALQINPANTNVCLKLSLFYEKQGRYAEAEGVLTRAAELDYSEGRIYEGLALLYERIGKYEPAKEYYDKADKLGVHSYSPAIRKNYLKIKEILDRHGIKMVAVQYPMRGIELLKEIFDNKEGIIFVDNEKVFKNAVNRECYENYFTDRFGGDIGHCTPKGNRLLAESIADTIIKAYFHPK